MSAILRAYVSDGNMLNEMNTIKPWVFDQNVANDFNEIANKNIPDYEQVITQCVQIISKIGIENPHIIDVGCATGNTLRHLYNAGFTRLTGVDSSEDMLRTIHLPIAQLILSNNFPCDQGHYDVVLANWTLHFIKDRKTYLTAIAESLSANGVLILTEKTQSSKVVQALYREFKRTNGLTNEEILIKEQQLEGVLTPYSVDWYLTLLPKLGFVEVEIINARYGFVSFLARK